MTTSGENGTHRQGSHGRCVECDEVSPCAGERRTPKPRPTFSIRFDFTDFSSFALDREALGDALFRLLIEGNYVLTPDEDGGQDADEDMLNDGWSVDGFEVTDG